MNQHEEAEAQAKAREEQERVDREMRILMAEREIAAQMGVESVSDRALREVTISDHIASGPDAWGRDRPAPAEDPIVKMSMEEYQTFRDELERSQSFGHTSGGRFPERFSGVAAEDDAAE